MSLIGIDFNNNAVAELRNGDIESAYGMLVFAYEQIKKTDDSLKSYHQNGHHQAGGAQQLPSCSYYFSWVDCTSSITQRLDKQIPKTDMSSVPFLYLKFLTIETPTNTRGDVEKRCSCGFAWAIWYNIGLVSTLMAGLKQQQTCAVVAAERRQHLLEQAIWMFGRAERVAKERSSEGDAKHWSLLSLSILNNQTCVLRDLGMDDQVILQRLVDMGLTLAKTIPMLDGQDQQSFLWTIQLLVQDQYAPAA